MKSLLVLLTLGLALFAGYVKTQYPDITLEEFKTTALSVTNDSVERVKTGFSTLKEANTIAKTQEAEQETLATTTATADDVMVQNGPENSDQSLLQNSLAADKALAATLQLQAQIEKANIVADIDNQKRQEHTKSTLTQLSSSLDTLFNKQEQSDERLSQLESTLTANEQTLQQLNQQLNALTSAEAPPSKEQLAEVTNKVDELNAQLEKQSQQLNNDNMHMALDELLIQVNQIEESTQENRTEFDKRSAELHNKIQAIIDVQLSSAATKTVSANETTPTSNPSEINTAATHAAATDALTTNTDQQEPSIVTAQLEEKITLLEERVSTLSEQSQQLDSLTEEVTQWSEKAATLESNNTQLSTAIEELNMQIERVGSDNKQVLVEDTQLQAQEQLGAQQTKTNEDSSAAASELSELTVTVTAALERLNSIEKQVAELPASSEETKTAAETQSQLQAQLTELEDKLNTLASTSNDETLSNSDAKQEGVSTSEASEASEASESLNGGEGLKVEKKSKNTEYRIYFDPNSTAITDAASDTLLTFIKDEQERTTAVSIYGFTDKTGPADYNQQLALQRATNVRSFLIQNGFDFSKIKSLSGLGEDAAAAKLLDDTEDAGQRMVVLYAAQP